MNDKLDVLATARCGCRVQRPIGTAIIQLAMCPLHAAAQQLLGTAQALLKVIDTMTTDDFSRGMERVEREALRAAIKAAEEPCAD